jgi:bacterioferritin
MARPSRITGLIEELNRDLALELGTVIRYNYEAAKAAGPQGEEVRSLLREGVAEELSHAAFLTDAIVRLGGEPTTNPSEFDKPCSLRLMLEIDLALERARCQRYRDHARVAGELNRPELQAKLEEIAAVEAEHAQEMERVLRQLSW